MVLYGGQTGQSVRVPVIPDGDWTVSSGQDVVLGPRPDGQPHQINGDLTVANNGALTLVSTTVVVAQENSITLVGTGRITGVDASLESDAVQASGQSMLTGTQTDRLTVLADVQWGCISPRDSIHLTVVGSLTVQPGCEVDITGEALMEPLWPRPGAVFTAFVHLDFCACFRQANPLRTR